MSILLLLGSSLNLLAQFNNTEEESYETEIVTGINFNTNGGFIGGFAFKYAKATATPKMYHNFGLDIVNVKHPKEQRIVNSISGNSYIPGKQNYLYVLRPTYGREYILFKKAREQGVQVSAISSIGPAIGLVAPYLVRVARNGVEVEEPYDINVHGLYGGNILGTGSFINSIKQSNINVGLTFKAAFSFEFGVIKSNVTGFESGIVMDLFKDEIKILSDDPGLEHIENRNFYTAIYLTFFFGVRN